jgi:leader peptidase (prepilin peptidase)/N-methyltransferase
VRYPVIEMIAGAIVILLFILLGAITQFIYIATFALLMLPVAIIDWQHLIIPNELIITGLIIGILLNGLFFPAMFLMNCLASIAAFGAVLFLMFAGNRLFHKPSMGMGDVKLAAVLGLFLGMQSLLIALWLAAILGSLFGMTKIVLVKGKKEGIKLPFGSFLAVASVLVLFFSNQINQLIEVWISPL